MAQAAGDKAGTNPFWTFSLEIYSSKAVQEACVELQDVSGVDVNVMLYVLWLADRGRRLSVAGGTEALRNMVKKVELEAERLQQWALFGWRPSEQIGVAAASRAEAAAANLDAYGKALGRELAAGPVGVMLEAHASRAA
jgi:hypothetical protein